MCPSLFWTVHRGTFPTPSPGSPLVVSRITPSARRRLAHRLKATSRGRKWAQMTSFSRKMSPPAFSRRCQAPPGGKTAQMTRHGVTREGWQGATARMTTSRLRCKHRHHLLAGDTLISSRCGAADKWLSCTTTWWQSVVIYYTCVNQVVSDDLAPNSVRQSAATMWDISYHVTQISLTRMSIHRSSQCLINGHLILFYVTYRQMINVSDNVNYMPADNLALAGTRVSAHTMPLLLTNPSS